MIKFYYEVNYVIFYRFDEVDKENVEDRHFIGYFPSKKRAMQVIKRYSRYDGADESNFQIIKRRVSFEGEEPKELYQSVHEYSIKVPGDLYVDYLYVFAPKATKKEAEELCDSLRNKKKYRKQENRIYYHSEDGFAIIKRQINPYFFPFSPQRSTELPVQQIVDQDEKRTT